jgi:hypothetical protein
MWRATLYQRPDAAGEGGGAGARTPALARRFRAPLTVGVSGSGAGCRGRGSGAIWLGFFSEVLFLYPIYPELWVDSYKLQRLFCKNGKHKSLTASCGHK